MNDPILTSTYTRNLILAVLRQTARAAIIGFFLTLPGQALAESALLNLHGEYLFKIAGCQGCHTATEPGSRPLAGGRTLKTPFGIFHTPNITPDPVYGIGAWSAYDFVKAMRHGIGRDGEYLYPAFPFTSYSKMSLYDIVAIYSYIQTLPPVAQPNKPHALDFPFNIRMALGPWRELYFSSPPLIPNRTAQPEAQSRGAYLAEAVAHCGECHTPRGVMGALETDQAMAGTSEGPEGEKVPNITPDRETGIGSWSDAQLQTLLKLGILPDGDVVGGGMGEVVQNSTSQMTQTDRDELVSYLKSLPAIENAQAPATQPEW